MIFFDILLYNLALTVFSCRTKAKFLWVGQEEFLTSIVLNETIVTIK